MQILIQSCHSVKIYLGERPPILTQNIFMGMKENLMSVFVYKRNLPLGPNIVLN